MADENMMCDICKESHSNPPRDYTHTPDTEVDESGTEREIRNR